MELNDINPNVLSVKPSSMREFDHEISDDPQIVKLTLGEPNFNVPEHIKQAAMDAIKDNHSHYPISGDIRNSEKPPRSIIRINSATIMELIKLL
ncbi:hypothetical protein [Lentilactobacillus parafarraginis]|uniref:hypothetical protein n=1 Tax=Lentilactobacillus parafarraginis TaxID=390842 RepID=UPI000A95615C|nr:hypothetical protein [Lentilactobacillus parafarraginis]